MASRHRPESPEIEGIQVDRDNRNCKSARRRWISPTALSILACLALAACNSTALNPSTKGDANAPLQPSFTDFSNMPIPSSARMDLDRSLILGPKDNWVGRLAFHASNSAAETFDFYANGMPRFGWQPVAVVRGSTSAMTYTRADRVATIQIVGTTFGGSDVTITVAPQGGAGSGSFSGGGNFGAGGGGSGSGGGSRIQSAPLP